MAVLAFDCCLGAISVAVDVAGRTTLLSERMPGGQAERLMPMIEAALAEAHVTFAQISRIAVTLGPGGFTSVRVGLAAARGLALALGVPAVGQPTLEALAQAAPDLPAHVTRVIATIPAGRGGLYWQAFDRPAIDRQARALSGPRVIEAEAFGAEVLGPEDAVIGPGATIFVAGLRAGGGQPDHAYILPDVLPRADILAQSAKHLTPVGELRPIYLRAADAKPQIGKALPRA